ncbi:MAG: DNA methyltransferase [Patescibacteria group bacterium]
MKNMVDTKERLNKIRDSIVVPKQDKIIKMYKIHKYWARKPWYYVNSYIKEFTNKGDVVFDPFSGSGVTGVESLVLDRNSILIDLNPVSTFVSRMTILNHNITEEIEIEFEKISVKLKNKLNKLYILSKKCEFCGSNYLGEYFERGPKFKSISAKAYCPNCGKRKTMKKLLLSEKDLQNLHKLEKSKIANWYPQNKFPEKFDKDRITYKGITSVDKLFTNRNLHALSTLLSVIQDIKDNNVKELLLLSFSDTLLHASKLKGANVRPLSVNNYWVPDDWIEENVWFRFAQRVENLLEGKKIANERIKNSDYSCEIFNQSSTDVSNIIKNDSIDFIFTDPPYGDSIQYDELSMVWNFWFKNEYKHDDEIIINRSKKKNIKNYEDLLSQVFSETFRVLKNEKFLMVTFHNKDFKVWSAIIRAIKGAGFSFCGLNIHDPLGNSFNKNWSKRSPKTDLYMLFKKSIKMNNSQLSLGFNLSEIDGIIDKYKAHGSTLNITNIYDEVLEKAIDYVFKTDDYESLKNISIYLIDRIMNLNDK